MPTITLPDHSRRQFDHPLTVQQVAAAIGPGLAGAALAGQVNGRLVDTSFVIDQDAELAIITARDEAGVEVLRHSCAHLLAMAVKGLFPTAQVTIGPVIEEGFYYDFAYERPFTPEDLEKIEARMVELAERDIPVVRQLMSRDQAIALFESMGEQYKVEIIREIPASEALSCYRQGDFIDLGDDLHPVQGKQLRAQHRRVVLIAVDNNHPNQPPHGILGSAFPGRTTHRHDAWLLPAIVHDHRPESASLPLP